MRYTALGSTSLDVSAMCVGTYTLTGAWEGAPDTSRAAVRTAFELGVNFFDTARAYGRAEALLAQTLDEVLATHRDEIVLCTKGGLDLRDRPGATTPFVPNSRPEFLRSCLEESLYRLRTDYVDVFLIHWYDPDVPVEEAAGAMAQLVDDGLTRHVGVSNYTVEQMRQFQTEANLGVTQVPYSLFSTEAEAAILPYCEAEGIGVMGYAALAQGFLTGSFRQDQVFADFRAHAPDFQGRRFADRVSAADRITEVARSLDCTLPEFAVAWTRAHPANVVPLVGIQEPAHAHSCASAIEHDLDELVVERARAIAQEAPAMDFEGLVAS